MNPDTMQYIYEGDYVRKYLYTDGGSRNGLSQAYEMVFYNSPINRFFLREASYMDYFDCVGYGEEIEVGVEFLEAYKMWRQKFLRRQIY